MAGKTKAVFIDRDGTLIHERYYLRRVRDVRLYAGAAAALKTLRAAGYKLIVVTNQSGVGRGFLTEEKLLQIHARLERLLSAAGVPLDAIYYCPHHPDVACSCRKPNLGMVEQARKKFNIDLKHSVVIGDKAQDVRLARAMGGYAVFVMTGQGRKQFQKLSEKNARPDHVAANILSAARHIVGRTHVPICHSRTL